MGGLIGSTDGRRSSLPQLFAAGETVLAPGCYDLLGARLIEAAGFPAAYMTGFGSSASHLGRPDVGLMSLPDMVDNARRIARAIEIPVIAGALFGEASQTEAEIETTARAFPDVPDGTPIELLPEMLGFDEFLDFIGLPEVRALERRFAEE